MYPNQATGSCCCIDVPDIAWRGQINKKISIYYHREETELKTESSRKIGRSEFKADRKHGSKTNLQTQSIAVQQQKGSTFRSIFFLMCVPSHLNSTGCDPPRAAQLSKVWT